MWIDVVENPRRKRRTTTKRRRARARTRTYAKPRRRRSYRRNPMLASLANPRRRRYSRRRYRRNPLPGLKGFDLGAAAWVGAGMIGSEMIPNLVRRSLWPGLPAAGPMVYLVKAGGTLVTAYGVKMLTRSNRNFQLVMAGGLGLMLVDLFRDYVAPQIGLSGYVGNGDYVSRMEIEDVYQGAGAAGYVQADNLGAYVDNPVGAY